MRTRRPVFARVLLDLQNGMARVLICDDVSQIARDERDALDLIDACELGGHLRSFPTTTRKT
jgi:DNA invertase Pin-like site-specific DNA recombinase